MRYDKPYWFGLSLLGGIISGLILLSGAISAPGPGFCAPGYAFSFSGYTYDTSKTPLNGTNVTVDLYSFGPQGLELNSSFTNLSNATGFSLSQRVENRVIIILGGPDALEGIGEIVSGLLSDAEKASVRGSGSQVFFVKSNVYTDRYVAGQKVIVIAGADRFSTRSAGITHSSGVKTQVLG
ncbi:hypothetical protein BMS3Abin16_00683 [archaeon BMS3Abin16]|nr:hypothetical protein BMS3Abin16_00683 [archaeon BMS3Abin16]